MRKLKEFKYLVIKFKYMEPRFLKNVVNMPYVFKKTRFHQNVGGWLDVTELTLKVNIII